MSDDINARVAALEEQLRNGLSLDNLPMAEVMRFVTQRSEVDHRTATQPLTTLTVKVPFANTPGPPTLSATVEHRGSKVLAVFAGSGFRAAAVGQIVVDLYLDGVYMSVNTGVYTNELNSHKATVPNAKLIDVTRGNHTWSLQAGGAGNSFDTEDKFTLVLFELPV